MTLLFVFSIESIKKNICEYFFSRNVFKKKIKTKLTNYGKPFCVFHFYNEFEVSCH